MTNETLKTVNQLPEERKTTKTDTLKTTLATIAIWWILSWSLDELKAQEIVKDRVDYQKEISMQQDSTSQEVAATINRFDASSSDWIWIEPDPDWNNGKSENEWEDKWEKDWGEKAPAIDTHGMLYGWTGVAWDFTEICSDKATMIAVVDMSNQVTWLWFTTVRLDDFHNDPNQPASRVTVLNPHLTKSFKDGKIKFSIEWKYALFDNMPKANWFTPDIVWSYSDNWWTIEWMYAHKFKDWPDSEAFRLSVSKKIGKALQLTAQWWYDTWYDKKFYGRVIADVDLWNWFWAQITYIAKYWKLTPTFAVIYKF